ncbi:T9SS type A sorting domain-containing protein [Hymenobacter cheonanensis]|uniref:T9SS type A sorting domain-containing protein n=1 Tax=Hymenobacter sp. CA2-7 TaxID=3063993 RepID=UPI0027136342|nr:T9SS type A sorting domain-containing protein [Hymenobacter sp. CA2-7]MDO7885983.1 T9SS type A sorting domain-containing protein [Hymenobacter sp. CA2-7]
MTGNIAWASDVLFDVYIGGDTQPCPGTTSTYSIAGDAANGFNIKINADAGTIVAWTDYRGNKYSNVSLQEISTYGYTNFNGQLSVTIRWTNVRGTLGHLHVTTSNDGFGWNNNHGDRTYEIAVGSPDITGTTTISSYETNCDLAHPSIYIPVVPGADSYTWQNTMGWVISSTYVSGGHAGVIFSTANSTATSGQVTVTANNSGCPSTSSTETFIINRTAGGIAIDGLDTMPGGTFAQYAAATDLFNYSWSFPNGWYITEGQGTAYVKVQVDNNYYSGNIILTYTDACGQQQTRTKAISSYYISSPPPPSTQDFGKVSTLEGSSPVESAQAEPAFYPNPATSQITVNLGEGGKAIIYNNIGAVVREVVFPTGSVSSSINTLSLPTGIYHVRLFKDGKQLLDKPLSVTH